MTAPSYSISIRLRRTTVEEVHISVPVTADLVTDDKRIDTTKLFAEAARIGREDPLAWRREGEPTVEPHPLQTPPPGLAGAPM